MRRYKNKTHKGRTSMGTLVFPLVLLFYNRKSIFKNLKILFLCVWHMCGHGGQRVTLWSWFPLSSYHGLPDLCGKGFAHWALSVAPESLLNIPIQHTNESCSVSFDEGLTRTLERVIFSGDFPFPTEAHGRPLLGPAFTVLQTLCDRASQDPETMATPRTWSWACVGS